LRLLSRFDLASADTPTWSERDHATWRNRALFANFYKRELITRYLGSITGLAWALIHPLALLGVYHFIFTGVFRAGRLGGTSFLVFVAVALWPWLASQEGMQRAAISIGNYSGLIRKVAFPHELIVFASVAATLSLQFVGYMIVLIALWVFGEPLRFEGLLLAIPLWLIVGIAVTGIALVLAALQVFIRDIEHVLMPSLMMLMFLTPILYPLTMVPESLRPWVAANPFSWVVERFRDALLRGNITPRWDDALALVVAISLFFAGRWVFRRLSPHFEDFV
jgi:lipopolysaccharide transport system permease protein